MGHYIILQTGNLKITTAGLKEKHCKVAVNSCTKGGEIWAFHKTGEHDIYKLNQTGMCMTSNHHCGLAYSSSVHGTGSPLAR